MRRIGAAAVIVDVDGRVLLVRHSYGRRNWEIPGGSSVAGESAAETVLREVREELGVEVAIERLTGVYYEGRPEGGGEDMHHFAFACRLADAKVPRPASREILACGYYTRTALPRPISDFTLRRIDDALAGSPPRVVEVGQRRWLP